MKRGQAALEFLTTYGWAFLVILVMIGAISYFGIYNPTKFLPSRCTVSTEFSCNDYKIDKAGNVQVYMAQNIGKTIYFNNITCTYNGITYPASPTMNPAAGSYWTWNPRNSMMLNCTGLPTSTVANQKTKVSFDITYQKTAGSLTHVASGEVFTEVK